MLEKYTKDDFDKLEQIGQGSYGSVFKAFDKKNSRIVAIKEFQLETDNWLPLISEVNMVIDLHDESIVNYYSWFVVDKNLWIIMEYCDCSLLDIINGFGHGLKEIQIAAVCNCLLKSLAYVHSKNRIHRDIKAGNLLINSNGKVKLCDFGVSAQLEDVDTKTHTFTGSPLWMAPEVISSSGHDFKADIWSFGITALELYLGDAPKHNLGTAAIMLIANGPPPEAPKTASDLFKRFISRILIKDPGLRPTAEELLKDPFIQTCGNHAVEIIQDLLLEYKQYCEEAEEDEIEDQQYTIASDGQRTLVTNPIAPSSIKTLELKPKRSLHRPSKPKTPSTMTPEAPDANSAACTERRTIGSTGANDVQKQMSRPIKMKPIDENDLEAICDNDDGEHADNTFVALPADAAASILYGSSGTFVVNSDNSGTFVENNTGTMVVNEGKQHTGLTGWNMQFLENPSHLKMAQKRKFKNFAESDLIYMLKSVKNIALLELQQGKDPKIVKTNYEEVRSGIVREMQLRKPETPDNYEKID